MSVVAQSTRKVRISHSERVIGELAWWEYVNYIGCLKHKTEINL